MLSELIGLGILLHISVHIPSKMLLMTRISVMLLMLSSVLIYVERWTGYFETLSVWRPILTFTIYALQPVILIVIIQIISPFRKWEFFLLLPELLSLPLYAVSQPLHVVCYFSEDNHYHGGPLSYLPYFIFGFYLLVFLGKFLLQFKKYAVRDWLSFLLIAGISASGVILFLITEYSSDYGAIFTSAILMFYLFLYIQMAKTDPLTQLLNRQCYYRDSEAYRSRITAVASIDMNELKWLNDSIGHEAGDLALKVISECLAVDKSNRKLVYRVGGDEFMIFYLGKTEDEVVADIAKMRAELAKTEYVCAFGYSTVNGESDLENAILRSDHKMYDNKSELKKAVLATGGSLHRRHDD